MISTRTHAAQPTTAPVVGSRAPMWSHAVMPFASPRSTATGFGTNGVYGTKRAARHLHERLT